MRAHMRDDPVPLSGHVALDPVLRQKLAKKESATEAVPG